MNIHPIGRALVLGGLVAVIMPSLSVAQPKDSTATPQKETGAVAPKEVAPNTNANPFKHRYWRHRGGRHPHYGSRRVRT
ncbi:hypothetical protein [Bradyrhizobium sp. CCBAU 51765]|jgi:hypothetical protein|uniref:hypothetical protein n=1 Tax=Bradyrhizobium sp. CCBAU 51765 TaxID=1325102 RepID=UPI001888938E|nr:hypothetical protein [Bradyrhizobium sp. CCBAU 51765]QOZ08020.1 hypothetical protein XH96_11135 [Bradyrhizobium sp. CCBAU 51765]